MYRARWLTALFMPGLVLLTGGCAVTQTDPLAATTGSMAPQCRMALPPDRTTTDWMKAAGRLFERHHYDVGETDVALGLVSASRVIDMPGLGAVNAGVVGGPFLHGSLSGDPWQVFRGDPRRIEAVTLWESSGEVLLARSSTVMSDQNYPIDARALARPSFCVPFFNQLQADLSVTASTTSGEAP
ncbi:hypothetical protein [Larsenimonas rhizosphaerae]|uniref:hypothetical protein n=1 Tax=Larsenimonas rhizosphaerae TaxID=2944682 RepID=UPI002033EC79|nr:hypothetical protein [Larsenimonas rhizosphaerae]MCM2129823.1 hypothetical protein [Larsenimonas rhizosphaerae]